MKIEVLRREMANTIFEKLFEVRKKGDGWFTAAEFMTDYIIKSNEWMPDPNIISYIEIAIKDLRAGIRQEKTSPDPRWGLVDEMKVMLTKLITYMQVNGFGNNAAVSLNVF